MLMLICLPELRDMGFPSMTGWNYTISLSLCQALRAFFCFVLVIRVVGKPSREARHSLSRDGGFMIGSRWRAPLSVPE